MNAKIVSYVHYYTATSSTCFVHLHKGVMYLKHATVADRDYAVGSRELWFEGQNKAAAWPGTRSSHRSPPACLSSRLGTWTVLRKEHQSAPQVIPTTNTKPCQWRESREGIDLSSWVPFYPYTFPTFYICHVFPNHLFCWLRLQQ